MVQPRSGCHRLPCYRLSLQLTTADVAVGFFAPCSAWLVVVVPLPTTLLLYPLSTTSDKCGCGRWHLCPLLSLVINFLSDWPTCSRHLVNTLASLYITLVGPLSVRASHLLNRTTTTPTPIPIFASPFTSIVNSPATFPSLPSSVEHQSTGSTTTTSSTFVFVVVPLPGIYPASSDSGCPHFSHLYSHTLHIVKLQSGCR